MALTSEQVEAYERDGFVIVEDMFTDDDLIPVTDEINRWIDERAQRLKSQNKLESLCQGQPFETRYAALFAQCDEIGQGMDIPQIGGEAMFAFLGNESLLDAVDTIVGPEITCNPIQHLRAKVPERLIRGRSYLQQTPWHQDAAVTWAEADPTNIMTVWIPLVDAMVERGCVQALPGVHMRGHMDHKSKGGTTIVPEQFPRGIAPVSAEVPRGGAILMSKYTPHHTLPNKSDVVRWSLDLRYQPNWQPTGRPFHPEFIVRSPSKPDQVLSDPELWRQLWQDAFQDSKVAGRSAHRTIYYR